MTSSDSIWFYGFHVCMGILRNPKRRLFEVVYLSPTALEKISSQLLQDTKLIQRDKYWFENRFGADAVHQGIAIRASRLETFDLEMLPQTCPNQLVVVLDQVNDPHNVGAILRSAAAFGAKCLIMTDRHGPSESAVLAKSASGALEIVPIARYVNLAQALEELKQHGFWIYGFAEQGNDYLSKIHFSGKVAIVLGAEGNGMRERTRKSCDFLLKLDTSSIFTTLNVSTAGSVAFYKVFTDFQKSSSA